MPTCWRRSYGTRAQLAQAGHTERALEELADLRAAYEEYLRGEHPRSQAQAAVDAAAREPWFELAWVPRELPEPGSWPDMDFDPLQPLSRVRCPVLALFGERDEWVPVKESIERFQSAAQTAGFDLTVRRLPDTTHEPLLASSGSISPLYEETLTTWIRGQTP